MIIDGAHMSFAASYRSEASQQRTQRSVGLPDLHPANRAEAPDSPLSSSREAVVNKFNAKFNARPLNLNYPAVL